MSPEGAPPRPPRRGPAARIRSRTVPLRGAVLAAAAACVAACAASSWVTAALLQQDSIPLSALDGQRAGAPEPMDPDQLAIGRVLAECQMRHLSADNCALANAAWARASDRYRIH